MLVPPRERRRDQESLAEDKWVSLGQTNKTFYSSCKHPISLLSLSAKITPLSVRQTAFFTFFLQYKSIIWVLQSLLFCSGISQSVNSSSSSAVKFRCDYAERGQKFLRSTKNHWKKTPVQIACMSLPQWMMRGEITCACTSCNFWFRPSFKVALPICPRFLRVSITLLVLLPLLGQKLHQTLMLSLWRSKVEERASSTIN